MIQKNVGIFVAFSLLSACGGSSEPSDDLESSSSPTTSGFTVLVASEIPVPGMPEATFLNPTSWALAQNGGIAVSANVRIDGTPETVVFRSDRTGALEPILQSDATIAGFEPNTWFESVVDIEIADDSTVWLLARMGGVSTDPAVIRIDPDGNASGLLNKGDRVSGLPETRTVDRVVELHFGGDRSFAKVSLTDPNETALVEVTEDITAVATSNLGNNPEALRIALPQRLDCIGGYSTRMPDIYSNDQGELVFNVALRASNGSSLCPGALDAAMRYKNGSFSTIVVADSDGSPDPDSEVGGGELLGLNNDGTAVYSIFSRNSELSSQFNRSIWVASESSTAKLVMVENESAPPDFTESLSFLSPLVLGAANYVAGFGRDSDGDITLYSGQARTEQPYATFANLAASQLRRRVGINSDPVPGMTNQSFFTNIESPVANGNNQLWFIANTRDIEGPSANFSGVWRIDPSDEMVLEVPGNISIDTGDQIISPRTLNSYTTNSLGDLLVEFSTSNDLIYKPAN